LSVGKSLSYSNFSALRKCGEYYRLSVVEKVPQPLNPNFEFGSALHAGLNAVLERENGIHVFEAYWDTLSNKEIDYGRFGHAYLRDIGAKFVERFERRLASKMRLIVGEKRMYALFEEIELEGTPDALVEWEGKNILLDFKSSAYNYEKTKTEISQQLNLYAYLLEQNGFIVDALCYIVFNKSAGSLQTPHIVQYDRKRAEGMIRDMVSYFLRNEGHHEKNFNACIMGTAICPYLELCK
jgi:CRISPR/Cas system-associated exonuclease Cas4 (RecB family)